VLIIPDPLPRTSGVYRITCLPTGKVYIGSAVNLRNRCIQHRSGLHTGRHPNSYLQRAWGKHGDDAFVFEVLELVLSPFLIEREQYWLDRTRAYDHERGYNMSRVAGSRSGVSHSAETRQKMAETHRRIMSSPERRAAVSRLHKGKVISDEQRRQTSLRQKGKPQPQEHLNAMTEITKKDYILTAPDGTEYYVHGLGPFCREHGLDASCMSAVAEGKRPQHKGWKCRRYK